MGKLHKDIAMFMVKCVDDNEKSQQQIIKVSVSLVLVATSIR